jgi:Bacterial regulatory helix-turn-helix protein, lysR family
MAVRKGVYPEAVNVEQGGGAGVSWSCTRSATLLLFARPETSRGPLSGATSSQPSLTRAVQKLEQELGGSLIHRERRRTHLTELGELVRPCSRKSLSHTERTKTAAEWHLSGKKAVLRLGIMPSIGPVRLAPFVGQFGAFRAVRGRSVARPAGREFSISHEFYAMTSDPLFLVLVGIVGLGFVLTLGSYLSIEKFTNTGGTP